MELISSFRLWLEDLVYYFVYFPLIIQIAIVVSIFAVTGTVFTYLYLMVFRWYKARQHKKEMPLREKGNELLLEHIIYKSVNNPEAAVTVPAGAFDALRLDKRWHSQVFKSQLLEYRRNFTGDIPDLLRRLYLELGLHKSTVSQLQSGSRKQMIAALAELTGMGVLLEKDYILTLTQSSDKYIREMARCYIVQCSPDAPFEFLDHVEEPISQWEQFELFRIISLRKDIPVPSFVRWINPVFHPTVVDLSLKLATYYQQPEAIPVIIRLLPNVDDTLRAAMINSLGKLVAIDAEPTLVAMYPEQTLRCKMEILKALGRIGSGNYLDFLRQELEQTDEFLLMKHTAHSIVAHQSLSSGLVTQLQHSLTGTRQLVLQHSLNPLIKY